MGIFSKKKQQVPKLPSLESSEIPEAPMPGYKPDYSFELPETPDELPEFLGRKKYDFEPQMPETQQSPETAQIQEKPQQFSEDMDAMIESEIEQIETPAYPQKPSVLPAEKEINFEEVQRIEEDEFEVEQDMIESLKETRNLDFSKPLFVLIDNYRGVLEELSETKNLLKNSEDILFRMNGLKNEMDKKYGLWNSQLEDVQRKLVFVDKTLFEGGIRG